MLENLEQLKSRTGSIEDLKNFMDSFPLEIEPFNPLLPIQLTDEDKIQLKEILSDRLEDLKLSADELKEVSTKIFEHIQETLVDVSEKLGEKTPNFDIQSIFTDVALGVGIGAGIGAMAGGFGAIPGSIIGGIIGAVGNISKQIAIHNGASELEGTGIQMAIEMLSGVALAKLSVTVGKGLISSTDDIASVLKTTKLGEVVIDKVDDITRFTADRMKALEFNMKGLINDAKIHTFIDGNGEKLIAKMDEIIDLSRTIKMPYLGSNFKNTNSAGYLRDSVKFAQEYLKEFPETMSKNNIERITNKLSPIVDKQWIKFNPNHESFLGQTLHHHHINNTGIVAYLPEKLHNGAVNKLAVHVDEMELVKEAVSLIKEKITRS